MKVSSGNLVLFTAGMLLGATLIGSNVWADRTQAENVKNVLPLDELRTLSEIFDKVKSEYVEDVDDKVLLENAISGMLGGLDPHSAYLNMDDFKELTVGTTGQFGGLGIEVTMEDGFVKIVSPIDDTPAANAGVKAGDLVIRLDETPVKGMTLNEAVHMMRGKPGTDILLTIVREGVEKPLKIEITRDIIKIKSVKSRILEDGYGYLRISNFQTSSNDQVRKAVEGLIADSDGQIKGLVLDLRNNPGGVLGGAVSISDAFLTDGLIVYTEGRAQDSQLRYTATPDDVLNGAPMVVLINGGSASASEIVAGALQDHNRAVIMGTRSFGKGSVQSIIPMSNNTAIKITTARYFTPAGRSIQAEGIEPDVELEPVKVSKLEDNGFTPIKEADLSRHLENGKPHGSLKKDDAKKDKESAKEDGKEESLASTDYQLYQALTLLKGLNILSKQQLD